MIIIRVISSVIIIRVIRLRVISNLLETDESVAENTARTPISVNTPSASFVRNMTFGASTTDPGLDMPAL
jgi:hypothetical protein